MNRAISPRGALEPDDQLNVVQKPEFQAAQYATFQGSAHGHHHTSHHCTSDSAARRRRLVRPRTLVLNVADLKLGRRCNAVAEKCGLKATPAMAAGVTTRVWRMIDVVDMIDRC